MNLLIVGGAGYIGGFLTTLLDVAKHNFRVYDNLLFEETYRKPVPFVYGDIRDHKKLKEQLDWADTVVWLAAIVGDGAAAINPELSIEVNQESVKWLSKNFNGKIIQCSTCSVYRASDEILDETASTNPLSVYASTKLKAEEYLKDKNAVIFRLGTVFGVSDTYSRIRFDLVLNVMTMRALKEGQLHVFGGEQWRPIIHVRDVARAIIQAVAFEIPPGIYNLHRENIKIIDLANKIKEIIPNTKVIQTEKMFEDLRNYRVSSKKIIDTMKFVTANSVEDGIKDISTLILENRIKNVEDPRYSNVSFLKTNGEI